MTQQIPASPARETEHIPFYKKILQSFKPEKTPLPTLKDEYGEVMMVDDLCQKLEESIQSGDREHFENYSEQLRKLVHEVIIPHRESAMRVHAREKEEIGRHLNEYLGALASGNPILRYDFLSAMFRFIRMGDPTRTEDDVMILDIHTLLQGIRTRDEVLMVYNGAIIREQIVSRRRLYGVLGASVIALVAGASAWTFYEKKKETQERLDERTTELRESLDARTNVGVLEQQVNQLQTERQRLESEIQVREQVLQQREQNLQQRELQLQSQGQQLAEREQALELREQTLQATQEQIRELVQRTDELEAEIQRLQRGLEADQQQEMAPELMRIAQELREKARSGESLTPEEIELIRTASEALIAEWRGLTGRLNRVLREEIPSYEANSRSHQNIQEVETRVIREINEREQLIQGARKRLKY